MLLADIICKKYIPSFTVIRKTCRDRFYNLCYRAGHVARMEESKSEPTGKRPLERRRHR